MAEFGQHFRIWAGKNMASHMSPLPKYSRALECLWAVPVDYFTAGYPTFGDPIAIDVSCSITTTAHQREKRCERFPGNWDQTQMETRQRTPEELPKGPAR